MPNYNVDNWMARDIKWVERNVDCPSCDNGKVICYDDDGGFDQQPSYDICDRCEGKGYITVKMPV